MEDFDGALMDYDKAIELWPAGEENKVELIGICLERGDTHYVMQNYELAIIDFSKAIEIDPTNVLAYVYRGDARDNSGLPKEAIEDYSKTIELDPADGSAYYNRAVTKKGMSDEKGACEDFKKAAALGFKGAEEYTAECK